MKIEIDDTVLIDTIVEKVVEKLRPSLDNSYKFEDNELVDVKGLAGCLKIKKSSIYDKVHTRTIPFLKYGNSLRFRKKHIDIWLRNPYHPDLSNYNLNNNGRG
jgi:excisionase family DNA binding protein